MTAMTHAASAPAGGPCHGLRFEYLDRAGRALVFPCDAQGRVDVRAFSPSLQASYESARRRVGLDLAYPALVRLAASLSLPHCESP